MREESKEQIRKKILNLLKTQEEEEKLRKSLVISDKLFAMKEFRLAQVIMFYASFDGEVETFKMMRQALQWGKRVVLPIILREKNRLVPCLVDNLDNLTEGPYGIKQPRENAGGYLDANQIDLVVVPGVAFDKHNNRLGRGAGYYDRFLKDLDARVPRIGLAFDFQILDFLPHHSQDMPVSHVIVN